MVLIEYPLPGPPPPGPSPLPLSPLLSDRLTEGMRELEVIVEKRDVSLCAAMLLIYAHKKCKTIGECANT